MNRQPHIQFLTEDKNIQDICRQYWELVSIEYPPYYNFAYEVMFLAEKFSFKSRNALYTCVQESCKVYINCERCSQQIRLGSRGDYNGLYKFNPLFLRSEAVREILCKDCQRERQMNEHTFNPTFEINNSYRDASGLALPVDLPIVANNPNVKNILNPGSSRHRCFIELSYNYTNVFPSIPLAVMIDVEKIAHLFNTKSQPTWRRDFFFSRCNYVICNESFMPIVAIDVNERLCETEDEKTLFKRKIYTQVGMLYYILPRDTDTVFSDELINIINS